MMAISGFIGRATAPFTWKRLLAGLGLLSALFASAQPPYLKKLTFNISAGFATQSVHPTPDDHFILSFNPRISGSGAPVGFLKTDALGNVTEVRGFDAGKTGGNQILDMLELPDGDRLCLMQLEVQVDGVDAARPRYFLKKYDASMKEKWSLSLTEGRSFIRSVPALFVTPEGVIYGIGERFVLTVTGFQVTHLIFKVSSEGQLAWCKETEWVIADAAMEKNGNLILACTRFKEEGSLVVRLNSNGAVTETRRISAFAVRDLDFFPGGDMLLSGHDPGSDAGKMMMRISPSLKKIAARRLSNRSFSSELRNVFVANDQLLYYFFDPPDGEFGRVMLRLNGALELEKAVLLPEEAGHAVSPVALGETGFLMPTRVAVHSLSISLLHLDSSMALPGGCPMPAYCHSAQAANIDLTTDGAIDFSDITPQQIKQSVEWKTFQVNALDYCFDYTPPKAAFSLPDTICQGALLTFDTLSSYDGAYWNWYFEGGTPQNGDNPRPEARFNTTGRHLISQKVRFLGCREDYYERSVEVVARPAVSLGRDTSLCVGQTLLLRPFTQGAHQWLWDDQSVGPQRAVSSGGRYQVTVSNGACAASDTIQVAFIEADAAFAAADSICAGETIRLTPDNITPGILHAWTFDPPLASSVNTLYPPPIRVDRAGDYKVRHKVSLGLCADEMEKTVRVAPLPEIELGRDTVVCADSALLIRPSTRNVQSFAWNDGYPALERPAYAPGLFILSARNAMCRAADTLRLAGRACDPRPYYIPNTFSPSGLGENATFKAFYNAKISGVPLLEVYDRWGALVFRSENETAWDGSVKGKTGEKGVYVYRIVLAFANGKTETLTGTVSLL